MLLAMSVISISIEGSCECHAGRTHRYVVASLLLGSCQDSGNQSCVYDHARMASAREGTTELMFLVYFWEEGVGPVEPGETCTLNTMAGNVSNMEYSQVTEIH